MKSEETVNEDPIILNEVDIEEKKKEALDKASKATHNWKQKGVWVECDACEYPHGFSIGTNRKLTGIDGSGKPIIT